MPNSHKNKEKFKRVAQREARLSQSTWKQFEPEELS